MATYINNSNILTYTCIGIMSTSIEEKNQKTLYVIGAGLPQTGPEVTDKKIIDISEIYSLAHRYIQMYRDKDRGYMWQLATINVRYSGPGRSRIESTLFVDNKLDSRWTGGYPVVGAQFFSDIFRKQLEVHQIKWTYKNSEKVLSAQEKFNFSCFVEGGVK